MSMTPYTFDLEPGQTKHQTFGEANFIFVDFADRELEVSINGSWQTLRKGTKFKSRTGMFDQFEIRNPDPNRPCRVVMFIGTDEIENLIVEGEISIVPILRSADGTTKPDTRHEVVIDLFPSRLELTTYAQGEAVAVGSAQPGAITDVSGVWLFLGDQDETWVSTRSGSSYLYIERFGKYGQYLGRLDYSATGFISAAAFVKPPGEPVLYLDIGVAPIQVKRLNDKQTVYTMAGNIYRSVAYIPERDQYLAHHTGTNNLAWLDRSFQVIETFSGAFPGRDWDEISLGYDAANERILVGELGNLHILNLDGSLIETVAAPTGTGAGFPGYIKGLFTRDGQNLVIQAERSISQTYVPALVALYDYTTKPEFISRRPGCGLLGSPFEADQLPQIKADITATGYYNGVVIEGEIIKAALEYHFRKEAPADYLDHVYQFSASRQKNGAPFQTQYAGNQTFERALIADDFGVLIPGRMTITIDNELTMGRDL